MAFALCGVLISGSVTPVYAADENTPKDENVYVNLNQDGSVDGIYVVNSYRLDADTQIVDYGNYESVKNLTSDAEIQQQKGTVTVDAQAGEFFYQGNLQSKEIPWEISISYTLDGKEVSAKELAGKNGKLGISIHVGQNDQVDSEFFDNYLLQVTLTMDMERCSNLEAPGATAANVGTDKSPEQCIDALEGTLKDTVSDIASLTRENADLYTEYLSARPLLTDSQQILTELENDTLIDFPEPPDVAYTLKNVPDALSSTSASAFYLLPPVDSEDANIIYLNQSRVSPEDQFSTLAHEGYPGHLYQTNYYLSTDPEPLRSMLRCDGYDEGWGTYAQLYSYRYLEFADTDRETEESLQQLYRDNDILSLSLAALSDLYVNYENYTPEALAEYLSAYGVTAEGARSLYEYVIENPTTYLSYSIGWYELEQLRNTMEKELEIG